MIGQVTQISILAGVQHLIPSLSIHSWFMCAAHLSSISIFALTKNECSNFINKISQLRSKKNDSSRLLISYVFSRNEKCL